MILYSLSSGEHKLQQPLKSDCVNCQSSSRNGKIDLDDLYCCSPSDDHTTFLFSEKLNRHATPHLSSTMKLKMLEQLFSYMYPAGRRCFDSPLQHHVECKTAVDGRSVNIYLDHITWFAIIQLV